MAGFFASGARFTIGTGADAESPLAAFEPDVRTAVDTTPPTSGPAGRVWALPVSAGLAPHPQLEQLGRLSLPGVVMPMARIASHGRDWILCRDPVGRPPVLRNGAFDEASLVSRVLRPAAAAVRALSEAGFTHRAIRPANIFCGEGIAFELGPFWLSPPASGQSSRFETVWTATCLREARGPGSTADDVYALGVLLLTLFLGELPLADLDDAEVIDRKIRLGSFAALVGERRLPSTLTDTLSAMLSDEPSQRPTPERLHLNGSAAGPKVIARRRVRAAVPLRLGERSVWTTPQLAGLIAIDPPLVRRALALGLVDQWLRRCLNEVVLAEKVDAVVWPPQGGSPLEGDAAEDEKAATAMLLVSRLLDPNAPLIWQGMSIRPDGLGTLLAGLDGRAEPERGRLLALIGSDAVVAYASTIEEDGPRETLRAFGVALRQKSRTPIALMALTYELNPSLACRSPLVADHAPSTILQMLNALEARSAAPSPSADEAGRGLRLDRAMLAFIAVRRRTPRPAQLVTGTLDQVRLFAGLCQEVRLTSLPGLARRLASEPLAELPNWPGSARRADRAARLEAIVAGGDLVLLLALLSDDDTLLRDRAEQTDAHARVRALVAVRDAVRDGNAARWLVARAAGREAISVVGIAASVIVLLAQLVP